MPATERGTEGVGGASIGRRRATVAAAVVVGAALLGATLRLDRGSRGSYVAGYAVAAVWIVASLSLRGRRRHRWPRSRPGELGAGVVLAAAMFGVFVVGALVGRHVSLLAGPIDAILKRADTGSVLAVLALALVNGVAEELFFRGALVEAIADRRRFVLATAVYVAVTAIAGNAALTVAAVVMGTVFMLERWYTRHLAAPIVTHLVWSTLMILAFPR